MRTASVASRRASSPTSLSSAGTSSQFPQQEIKDIPIDATIVGGKVVYERK